MKTKNRALSALLSIILLVAMIPLNMLAAPIDSEKPLSLTIYCQKNDLQLSGVSFSIYLVANCDENGIVSITDEFSSYNVEINGDTEELLRNAASTLEGYVLQDALVPYDSGKTDTDGIVSFPTSDKALTKGLYLVLAQKHVLDGKSYEFTPFLISLPTADSESDLWEYDVKASAKFTGNDISEGQTVTRKVLKVWKDEDNGTRRPAFIVVDLLKDGQIYKTETLTEANNWTCTWEELDAAASWRVTERTPEGYTVTISREGITYVVTNTYKDKTPDQPTSPDREPLLPQTGLLWWPVYMLTASGLLFIVIGLIRRKSSYGK